MGATKRKPVAPIPSDSDRAYLVRGVDLQWRAKRSSDGEIIAIADERAEAAHRARKQGYFFMY